MLAFILPFGLIPIGLFIAAGELIRKRGDPDTARRRYFLFLLWTNLGLWTLFTYMNWWMSKPSMGNLYNTLLAPVTSGVTALTLLHLGEWRGLHSTKKLIIVLVFLSLVLAQFWLAGTQNYEQRTEPLFLETAILTISAFLLLVWITGNRFPILVWFAALLYMVLFNILEGGALPFFEYGIDTWLGSTGIALYLILPAMVIPTAAMLTLNVLKPVASSTGLGLFVRRFGQAVFIVLLVAYFLYTVVWLCIWDGTDDGIRGILMIIVSIMTSVAAAMVIVMSTAGWRRWSGFVLAVLVIFGVRWAVTGPGNRFHPYDITEARASQIQAAIENYKTATGAYPDSLNELVPGKLWRIPRPMIVRGQGWCYQGGADYYRLGTIFREHWSSPYMSVRVYASEGNVPEGTWSCDERLAELMTQKAILDAPPVSTPQPTSIVAAQRTTVEPILNASHIAVGGWSPDGRTLVFGITGDSGDSAQPVEVDLRFINGETGEICQPRESKWKASERSDGLYEHYAWLQDGRFLYVSESGEMAIIKPCVDGREDLTSRYPVAFTQVASSDATGGYVLLKNQESYWILDGADLEIQQIPAVKPASLEYQKDWYGWSPDGNRLAISRMNGEDASEGAAVFIVDSISGNMEMNIPMVGSSEYVDAPRVDWLNSDEVLVQFADSLLILDLRSAPPRVTDLIRGVFLLDLAYPADFSSMDFVRDADGDGYSVGTRANHLHNQDAYVYDSKTEQVSEFKHDISTILFFPDGQCMRLPKWEDTPTYQDEYEMVWMDNSTEERQLVVEGHVPRSHPQLIPKCLPGASELVFSSSQGISLVSIPDGETIRFWALAGGAGLSTLVFPSPTGEALVVVADGKRLYYIPLP